MSCVTVAIKWSAPRMSTALSEVAAVACVAAGAFGSYTKGEFSPFLASAAFSLGFVLARHRVANGKPAQMQLLLILSLVCVSFLLHLLYLPAGLCCFFTLMLCKNELLLPPHAHPPTKKQ